MFGKIKNPELTVLNFSGQLQCRMDVKRQGLSEVYPKFWKIKPLEKQAGEILIIPAWTEAFDLIRKSLGVNLERDVLSAPLRIFLL